MTDERFKRRTIRLSPFVDSELVAIAEKNNITVNKLVSELIAYHINELDKVNNVGNVATILNKLESLQNDMDDFKKKYHWLNALTKQIFVNSGFRLNRDLKDDPIFNEFVNTRYKEKYETKYNS